MPSRPRVHQLVPITSLPFVNTARRLLPIEWLGEAFGLAQGSWQRPPRAGKLSNPGHLEENSVNHRVFETHIAPPWYSGGYACPSVISALKHGLCVGSSSPPGRARKAAAAPRPAALADAEKQPIIFQVDLGSG
ncbi:hypothetical protein P170DRAFT_487088 [Aspergillus steynii IBT 23096]|uniref:Uncharacterized protein n=1 Tax=Aspergillus steynii IBT 23096 TaxID=1392250 RepID=A0A2I2FQQ9_9EURO|nr:hypothetical protein P170DRAFT_487088 [Aspergillus steynii IBT 23096]